MYICAFACVCAHVRVYINTTLTHLTRTLENRKRQREAILHKRQHAERVKDETQRLYAVFFVCPTCMNVRVYVYINPCPYRSIDVAFMT